MTAKWIKITIAICLLMLIGIVFPYESDAKYSGPLFERRIHSIIDAFAQNYADKHQMKLINVGFFPELRENRNSNDTTYFGFWLAAHSITDLKECRVATTRLVSDFWNLVRNEPLARECLSEYHKFNKKNHNPSLGIEHIGVKIAYWDVNNDRPLLPHIAQAFFFDGKFHYYESVPQTQALRLVFEETYKDALTNLGRETEA